MAALINSGRESFCRFASRAVWRGTAHGCVVLLDIATRDHCGAWLRGRTAE